MNELALIAVHFELAQQQNNKCINLLKAVPDATINFDFAAMRLNITIPQIALLSSAHGYIPPEEWDEGIPALLLNYNFTGNRGNGNDSYFLVSSAGLILARGVYATMVLELFSRKWISFRTVE